ncbi:MAG: DNA adenine methylase [Planctomycetes bacterium]|nr:DNA adenine methylase [Planctomycetota bacterium]MCC7170070.1 DNA adenine methylase [Planctomycetota bacterium]
MQPRRKRSPKEQRRSAQQRRGPITLHGDEEAAAALGAAWEAADGEGRHLTHGIHAWPARLHPGTARTLIEAFSVPGDTVLDPFCGGGTVVLEAAVAGRNGLGSDLNPLAVAIARMRTEPLPDRSRDELEARARLAAERASQEQLTRLSGPGADVLYAAIDAHVLGELRGLVAAIRRETDVPTRRALELALSAIVVKVSKRRSETEHHHVPREIGKGRAKELFIAKAYELARAHAELAHELHGKTAVYRADARNFPLAEATVDLVTTSPPYVGTYDYAAVQELRAALFQVPLTRTIDAEIGARRLAFRDPDTALDRFHDDLANVLAEMRRVLRSSGCAVIVVGDSFARERHIDALAVVDDLAGRVGLQIVAAATQERAVQFRPVKDRVRRHGEHLVLLAPTTGSRAGHSRGRGKES